MYKNNFETTPLLRGNMAEHSTAHSSSLVPSHHTSRDQLTAALWRHPISRNHLNQIGMSVPDDLNLYQMLTGRNKDELVRGFISGEPYDSVPETKRPVGVIFLWSKIDGVRSTYECLRDKFQQYGREDLVSILTKTVTETVDAEISTQSDVGGMQYFCSPMNQPCSGKHLYEISQSIEYWNKIIPFLGLDQHDYMAITSNAFQRFNPSLQFDIKIPSNQSYVEEMLRMWCVNYGSKATYNELSISFRECGRQDLVELIRKMVTPQNNVSTLEFSIDNVMYVLMRHNFPVEKWSTLASCLRRTTAIATITADHNSSHDRLVALITGWIQDDPTASWKELVDAVEMCPLKVIAEKIASDVLS